MVQGRKHRQEVFVVLCSQSGQLWGTSFTYCNIRAQSLLVPPHERQYVRRGSRIWRWKEPDPGDSPGVPAGHGGTCKDTLSQRGGGLLQSRTRGQQRPKVYTTLSMSVCLHLPCMFILQYIGDKRLYEESVGAQQKEKKEK